METPPGIFKSELSILCLEGKKNPTHFEYISIYKNLHSFDAMGENWFLSSGNI